MNIDASKIKGILNKLKHRDPTLFDIVQKKIIWISNLDKIVFEKHFKNLRYELSGFKRIHIKNNFVLFFKIENDTVIFTEFAHHDEAYRR